MNFKNPIIAKSSRWKMVTSSQLGNLVVTYTLYLMKRTGRNSSQRFINGSNSAKERPGESKKKKKKSRKFSTVLFLEAIDRSIWRRRREPVIARSRAPIRQNLRKRRALCTLLEESCRSYDFTFILFLLVEIPRVVQTQGTAGEESGEHEDDDDDRGYDGRAGE